ncbi:aldolase/citrate lyase family protein [Dinoroseobacter sp. PD6]|uniref:HpcH/HpaI aldolase family protein n=1 Tax=Dinoroseobacter sp. PD6 TaxID=3028384 RepID=UPI00237AC5A1|nr:aldolase/citrate lyase family protein [Dinoroseobacter sp. PD6]MDD9717986.1 aldolase/citrate lyase family protein [Dinoroseobacter sp. PD6]
MRPNKLRALLAQDTPIVNAWLSIPSGYVAEGAGHQGFDSVTVDLQHGLIGFETAVSMLQAISATEAVPLVRSPSKAPEVIMHLLDAGAYGLICPMISTPEEAAAFVAACRYPPQGSRSFGPARGKLYGGPDYFEAANAEILAIPMIETAEAVDRIEAILAVPGVNMIYVGPNDLALDLGEGPGAERHPGATTDAIAHVLDRARAAGVATGIFCADGALSRQRLTEGFDLVTPGNDFNLLMGAMSAAIAETRRP